MTEELPPIGSLYPPKIMTDHGWEDGHGDVRFADKYPKLYALLRETFNRGDEEPGTFRLPDLRGRVERIYPRGRGQ